MLEEKLLFIRDAEIKDIETIKKIEIESNLSPWSVTDYTNELNRKDSIFLSAEYKSETIGFLVARLIMNQSIYSSSFYKINRLKTENNIMLGEISKHLNLVLNEIEIFNIGVFFEYRRNRVGGYLLKKLLEKAKESKTNSIFLEVRKSNLSAISFYQNFNFSVIYERRNLYTNPEENGLGMKLTLSGLQNQLDMNFL